jgi:hypothetical protein
MGGTKQLAVLSAALRIGRSFTTTDLVRESGSSRHVVAKTFQRYEGFFDEVGDELLPGGGVVKLRTLTTEGRERILGEIKKLRDALPPPAVPAGPRAAAGGRSREAAAAKRVLFEVLPTAPAEARSMLLGEVRTYVEFGLGRAERDGDEMAGSLLRRLRGLHGLLEDFLGASVALLEVAGHTQAADSAGQLSEAFLDREAARQFVRAKPPVGAKGAELNFVRPILPRLLAARQKSPAEADAFVRSLLALAGSEDWRGALTLPEPLLNEREQAFLEREFGRHADVLPPEPQLILRNIAAGRFVVIDVKAPRTRELALEAAQAFLTATFGSDGDSHPSMDLEGLLKDVSHDAARSVARWATNAWWRLCHEPSTWGRPSPDWLRAHMLPKTEFLGDAAPVVSVLGTTACAGTIGKTFPGVGPTLRIFVAGQTATERFCERTDAFVAIVLTANPTVQRSNLRAAWGRLRHERSDPYWSRYRKLEALMSYDRGKAPPGVMALLTGELSNAIGDAACDEVAACAGHLSATSLLEAVSQLVAGPRGPYCAPIRFGADLAGTRPSASPWKVGVDLARLCRNAIGSPVGALSNDALADFLGIRVNQLTSNEVSPDLPFSVAVRTSGWSLNLRRQSLAARRFEAARLLAGMTLFPSRTLVLSSEAKTEEQLIQRAFASELLVPLETLHGQLNGNFSPSAIESAAERFGVSSVMVQNHLSSAEE